MTTENVKPPETPAPQPPLPVATPPAPEPVKTDKTYTQDEVEQMIKERLDREKSKREKEAAEARTKAETEAAAKNQEWEKLAKQRENELTETKRQLADRDLADKKRAVAEKIGLPPTLASRLIGTTDEELEKDAKALLETLPKGKPANPPPANPGIGGQPNETRAQKKARLEGSNPDVFATGGGINYGPISKE